MSGAGPDAPLWVVGGGGLVGSAVRAVAAGRDGEWGPPSAVPWSDPEAWEVLADHAAAFARDVGSGPWQLAWCAGVGATGASAEALEAETAVLGHLLDRVAAELGPDGLRRGAVFLSSSVGGVYAGASDPPFTERSTPRPLSAYGRAKLAQEAAATSWAVRTGARLVIGRLTNVYGPRQDLTKAQGLVSHVARSSLLRRPVGIYVPLDTVRDYLYAADAGSLVVDCLDRALRRHGAGATTKILASHQPMTVGVVVAELARLLRRRLPVVYAQDATSRAQAPDLRVRSTTWADLDVRPRTPFPVGAAAVIAGLQGQLRRGDLR